MGETRVGSKFLFLFRFYILTQIYSSIEEVTRLVSCVVKENSDIKLNTFKQPPKKFKEVDVVKIKKNHKGKYDDLYGKERIVHNVGKSFIFFRVASIFVL